jgi:hypothetical protein
VKHTHHWQGQTLTHEHGGDEVGPFIAPGSPEHVRIALHGYFGHVQDQPDGPGSLEPREFGIPIVWDVTAASYEEAAEHLCRVFKGDGGLLPSIRHLDDKEHQVESWWFPEARLKHIDGNDNDAFNLVHLDGFAGRDLHDQLETCSQLYHDKDADPAALVSALQDALEEALERLGLDVCDTCLSPNMDTMKCPNLKRTCVDCCGEGDH